MMNRFGIRCPHCGGEIFASDGAVFGSCSSCGGELVLAGEKYRVLCQADFLRQRGDFDDALNHFRALAKIDSSNHEIFWGITLCNYGVTCPSNHGSLASSCAHSQNESFGQTFGGDSAFGNEITCLRQVKKSIFFDESYLKAVRLADPETKNEYRTRAIIIDNIQERMVSKLTPTKLTPQKRDRHHFVSMRENAEKALKADRAAMKRAIDQRKAFEVEKEKLERILNTPNYYRKKERRSINNNLWLRILFTVLLLIFIGPSMDSFGIDGSFKYLVSGILLFFGLLIIWYKQFTPIKQSHIDKLRLIDTEREKQLRERIIQCDIQVTSLAHKLEKSKQALEHAKRNLID